MSDSMATRAAEQLGDAVDARVRAEVAEAVAIADYATAHEWHSGDPYDVIGTRPVRLGADGTPLLDEFVALELAALKQISIAAATWLIRDILNLRDRHPQLWQQVQDGALPVFRACQLVQEVARWGLDAGQARELDAQLAPKAGLLGWPRLVRLCRGLMCQLAPERAIDTAQRARAERYVRKSAAEDPAVSYLNARVDTSDAIFFDAMVDRIADILADQGDEDTKEVRRAKSIGILATPVRAHLLLDEAAGGQASQLDEETVRTAGVEWHDGSPSGSETRGGRLAVDGSCGGSLEMDEYRDGPPEEDEYRDGPPEEDEYRDRPPEVDQYRDRPPEVDQYRDRPPEVDQYRDRPPEADEYRDDPPEMDEYRDRPPELDGYRDDPPEVDQYRDGPDERDDPRDGEHRSRPVREPAGRSRTRPPIASTDPRLLPEARLYVHIAAESLIEGGGTARIEDVGALALASLTDLLGHCRVRVTPVVELYSEAAVDAYEVPDAMREQVILRDACEVFPFSSRTARHADFDHTVPYRSGVKGQTRSTNLGPLWRRIHRAKTHGRWRLAQPRSGVFWWTTPSGIRFRVGPEGSQRVAATPATSIAELYFADQSL
jgi:hypothetical protein